MANNTLFPIKGISQSMVEALAELKIYDLSSLLLMARTPNKRSEIAQSLTVLMHRTVDVRLVNNWLRQADLLRIVGMTPNLAYLLSLVGIRCVKDLSQVDADKALPLVQALSTTHPDFTVISQGQTLVGLLGNMIASATSMVDANDSYQMDVSDQAEPTHILVSKRNLAKDYMSDAAIIQEGLSFLKDLPIALPVPHYLCGTLKMRNEGQPDDEARPRNGLDVQLDGILSANEDAQENTVAYHAYTDGNGQFRIVLPDAYNFSEMVTLTIVKGSYKQKFVFTKAEILDKVFLCCANGEKMTVNALLNTYDQLDAINESIQKAQEDLSLVEQVEAKVSALKNLAEETISGAEAQTLSALQGYLLKMKSAEVLAQEITAYEARRSELMETIATADATTDDLELTLTNVINSKTLEAELDVIILTREIFEGYTDTRSKALPEVKLSGNGSDATYLPTDTAPSRVFKYTMLQRLVEPTVRNMTQRARLDRPIDVLDFRTKMNQSPDEFPLMASLGIGYVLNMHQSWRPDGFALGTLLYSLVLAPGEEQRMVVKEKTQSYSILDESYGTDATSNSNVQNQTDYTEAAYVYALGKCSEASGNSSASSSGWSIGASAAYTGIGINGGYSSTTSKTNSSARQNNNMDEASAASQQFQHTIQSAAQKISQANRLSVRIASSDEQDSVASKIVANHNHSHAMTVQYWEVMRRYRLETCIEGVDLVLFVPLKPIKFLNQGNLDDDVSQSMTPSMFAQRYKTILRHFDTLYSAVPSRYRQGLDLMQKYAALPYWKMQKSSDASNMIVTVSLSGVFLEFDDIQATLVLKNGGGTVRGFVSNSPEYIEVTPLAKVQKRQDIIDYIKRLRREGSMSTIEFQFVLPENATVLDLNYVKFHRNAADFTYTYNADTSDFTTSEQKAISNYESKLEDLYKDNTSNAKDKRRIRHYAEGVPECYLTKYVTLAGSELVSLDEIELGGVSAKSGDTAVNCTMSSAEMSQSDITASLSFYLPVLQFRDLQKIEAATRHIVAETVRYSQSVWAALTESERAMLLDAYTIDMNFDEGEDNEVYKALGISNTDIPLLNCVNVNKLLGFYGNCMLLPFTYPRELATKIGRTAKEIQDALYRYHANNFRVPSTLVSMPTQGMIGEAVLGDTNVSEEIDLTRFWKWDDSPIDKMEITKDYFNEKSYLSDKSNKSISALNLGNADLTTAIQNTSDLLSAIKSRDTTGLFNNLAETGLSQLSTALGNSTTNANSLLNKTLTTSSENAVKAYETAEALEKDDKETEDEIEKINSSSDSEASSSDSKTSSSGSKDGKTTSGSSTSSGGKSEVASSAGQGQNIGTINIYVNGEKVTAEKVTPNSDQTSKETKNK